MQTKQELKEKMDLHNGVMAGLGGTMALLTGAKLIGASLGTIAPIALPLGLGTAVGFWWLLRGDGIPDQVEPQQPDPSKGYAVMAGRTNRNRPVWFSLGRTAPHMMVVGSTGYGKTAFVKYVLYTIAHQVRKFDLKIIDLKQKASFGQWDHLPFCSEVVGNKTGALKVLAKVEEEMYRRLKLLDESRHRFEEDPYFEPLVVVVDEGSLLAHEDEALEHLHNIAAIGREPRVHLIYCTQHPSFRIIPVEVRDQFGARFAFHLDEQTGSEVTLGKGDYRAYETMQTPGRCIFKGGRLDLVMQVPYIPDNVITAWIKSYADKAEASTGRESASSTLDTQTKLPGF